MSEIVGIWTGFGEAHVLESSGIDSLVNSRGNVQIRVEGHTLLPTMKNMRRNIK